MVVGPKTKEGREDWEIIPGSAVSPPSKDKSITLPPKHLSNTAKEHFQVLIKRVRDAGKTEDLIPITNAAELFGVKQSAYEDMVKFGPVVESQHSDGKKNPASQVYLQSQAAYFKILKVLGIELVGKPKRKQASEMEGLLNNPGRNPDGDSEADE